MWNEIKAGQEGSNCSYLALKYIYQFMTGEITARECDDHLTLDCGVACQVLLSESGEEIGIRVLADLTTLTNAEDIDFVRVG